MNLTLDEALQKGIEAQGTGNIQEADKFYTAILKAQPNHPDANHNMGILAAGVGKTDLAISFFKTALEAKPSEVQFWLSCIGALIKFGRLADAKYVFDQAKEQGAKGDVFDNLEAKLVAAKLNPLQGGSQENTTSITQEPSAAECQHNINLFSQGQFQQALIEANKMLGTYPNSAFLHNIIGASNTSLKDFDAAIESYKKALKINPHYTDAIYSMGVAQQEQGDLDAATTSYNKVLKIEPEYIEAYLNIAKLLKDKGDLEGAILNYKQALKIKPDNAEVSYNMGNTLRDKGDPDAAIESYKKALKIKPDYAEAHNNMGSALRDKGDPDAAIESYKKALKIKPDYAEAYSNMGTALKDKGDPDAAIESYKKALKIQPDFAEAYNNMGTALKDKGDPDAAIESFKKALKIQPDYAEAHNNMGTALKDKGDPDAAIESYKKALKIQPDYAEVHHNMSLELLKDHKFERGFNLYEWRWKTKKRIGRQLITSKPLWNGEKNRAVFIRSEQGIGDVIMFSSLIPDLHAVCSKLIVQCDKRLIPLFQRSFPEDIIYQSDRSLVTEDLYDFHTPIGSLARIFRTSLESFQEASNGYLSHDKVKTEKLRQKILMGKAKTLIGISWSSSASGPNVGARNIPLSELAQVFDTLDTQLVCLQYGEVSDEINNLKKEFGINVMQVAEIDKRNDIDGLASLIMACDEVVSTSGVTLPLSGALGANCRALLPFESNWFWGKEPQSTYWFSSLKLYRQNDAKNWVSVFNSIKIDLKDKVSLDYT